MTELAVAGHHEITNFYNDLNLQAGDLRLGWPLFVGSGTQSSM